MPLIASSLAPGHPQTTPPPAWLTAAQRPATEVAPQLVATRAGRGHCLGGGDHLYGMGVRRQSNAFQCSNFVWGTRYCKVERIMARADKHAMEQSLTSTKGRNHA